VLFNVSCNAGTLVAIAILLRREIVEALTVRREVLKWLVLATLPLAPFVLIFKPIKQALADPHVLGPMFMVTGLILVVSHHLARKPVGKGSGPQAVLVGCAQAGALLPGVSRSGLTLSAMRVLGWEESWAKRFAFLMAIPAGLGSIAMELLSVATGDSTLPSIPWTYYAIGFTASLLCGLVAFRFFLYTLKLSWFRFFGWYCLVLGAATTLWLR
jgi:undecaprenyl-diphosphatase